MRPLRACFLLALALSVPGAAKAQKTRAEWDRAEARIVRRPPAEFPSLPGWARLELERRHCTIPQSDASPRPHNVLRAHLASPGQTDVAALCSVEGKSEVVILWGGPKRCPARPPDPRPDRDYLQAMEGDSIVYSREIRAVDRRFLLRHGAAEPPRIDHQGIEDSFRYKASRVEYCSRGKWVALRGAD